jgi:hypothetical protein
MSKQDRSALAKFRCGTAPIKLETGRYTNMALEERLCPMGCGVVESEEHVLVECAVYGDLRTDLLYTARFHNPHFDTESSATKIHILKTISEVTKTAKLCKLI